MLPNLLVLKCCGDVTRLASWTYISQIPTLTSLHCGIIHAISSIVFNSLLKLRELLFSFNNDAPLSLIVFKQICMLPELQSLNLSGHVFPSTCTDKDLQCITAAKQLHKFNLNQLMGHDIAAITGAFLNYFVDLPYFHSLTIKGCNNMDGVVTGSAIMKLHIFIFHLCYFS